MSGARRPYVALASLIATIAVAGCGRSAPDLVHGKELFTEKCGSCHTLRRAGAAGTVGPNLDDAFRAARQEGFGSDVIVGVVRHQISYPRRGSTMPAGLVSGGAANDVAAYVGAVAGVPGQDTGALAEAGLAGATTGNQIFVAAGCGACHTLSSAGTTGTVGPNLNSLPASAARFAASLHETAAQYVEQSIVSPNAFIVPGYRPNVMPQDFGTRLTKAQVTALVRYLLAMR